MTTKPELRFPELPNPDPICMPSGWIRYTEDALKQYGTLCYEAGLAAGRGKAGQHQLEKGDIATLLREHDDPRLYEEADLLMCAASDEIIRLRDSLRQSLAQPAQEPRNPTDISTRLLEYASNPGYSHNDYADTMRAAAEEIERYYGGMMAWKRTAEAKDAAQQPAQAAVPEGGLSEGIDLLDSLIDSIRKGGNYTVASTLIFLGQIRQCFAAPDSGEG